MCLSTVETTIRSGPVVTFSSSAGKEGESADLHSETGLRAPDPPRIGGGIRHVFDCLQAYLQAERADLPKLINYANHLDNGAVFKRLGFLLSRLGTDEQVLDACQARLTAGNAQLDPSIPSRRLVKRWQLWIPQS